MRAAPYIHFIRPNNILDKIPTDFTSNSRRIEPVMPPHGPGPQPPSDGRPFFLILTITVKDAASTDELGEILKGQKDWSLAQGAKSFSIGRNVSENSISVVEVNIASE